ncbi:PAS domain S-box protein [Echinicola soli]|uniref:histidine kinase n=1 Tax=Echinicola soli TaxID=2591634 RepID=A0A514CEF2_9BACT|nr:PAS domain-containing protein [Echinicola soli]QDH78198.1 PAS domain S-box protein [Echinicola soli]
MLQDINIFYVSISLVPALFNAAIFCYIFYVYPSTRETNIFLLFLVSLIVWQIQDTLMRLNIDYETACHISRSLDFGWMFIGALILHFLCYYTNHHVIKNRSFLIIIYGVSALLYICYLANLDEVILSYDKNWGYITGIRPGSYDLLSRAWVAILALASLGILVVEYFNKRNSPIMRKQILVLFLGAFLPVLQGAVTQLYFSAVGMTDIPVTSTTLTCFSFASVIALRKFKLFDVSSSIASGKIVKQIENGVMALSPDDKIVYLNPSACKLFGVDRHDGDLGTLKKFFETESAYKNFLKDLRFQLGKRKMESCSAQLISQDGKLLQILFTASVFDYGMGKKGTLVIFNDITELKEANHVIQMVNKRYDFITRASEEAVWEWSFEDKTIYWNENYEGLFGHKAPFGKSSYQHWIDQLHPEDKDRVLDKMNEHISKKLETRWEEKYRFRKSDGTYANVFDKGFIIYDEHGEAVRMVGTMQDLSKIKVYIDKIERQNQEFTEITWMQSHEVRAPLSRLMGMVNYIKEYGYDEEADKCFLNEIAASCDELDRVVHRIIDRVQKLRN